MAVVVHANDSIDAALKRLMREVAREGILEEYRNRQYHKSRAADQIQKRRIWKKMKKRRRAAARRQN